MSKIKKIAIGNDHAGVKMKEDITAYLQEKSLQTGPGNRNRSIPPD